MLHVNKSTINAYTTTFKPFYERFLNKPGVVKSLKFYTEDLQPITPSEILTIKEVVKRANEVGKRREMYKVMVLTVDKGYASYQFGPRAPIGYRYWKGDSPQKEML